MTRRDVRSVRSQEVIKLDAGYIGNWIALPQQQLRQALQGRSSAHMAADLPLKLLLITFAGFVNRDHSRLIAYLVVSENRIAFQQHELHRPLECR